MIRDAPTREQDFVGAHELVRRRANIHAEVVQDEVLERNQLACAPHRSAGVVEVGSKDKGLGDGIERNRSSSRASTSNATSNGACRRANESES